MNNDTIGKRIQTLRKEKGLTQKQLAEQVGVTPQAVSKWETDESCPDISILPSLAAVLGVSTDTLLGAETRQDIPVKEAELVTAEENEEQENHGDFHFEFHAGKLGGILFGLFLLSTAALLFLTKQVGWFAEHDVGFWSLLWPTALIFAGLTGTCSRDFSGFSLGMLLLGIICLLNNLSVIRIDNIWLLIVVGLLVIIGISTIISQFTKKKPSHYKKKGSPKFKYTDLDGMIDYEAAFGERDVIAEAKHIAGGKIETAFGDFSLDLRGAASFAPDARLDMDISFGDFTLYLPKTVRVETDKDGSFSSFETDGGPAANAPYCLTVHSKVNFGELTIEY